MNEEAVSETTDEKSYIRGKILYTIFQNESENFSIASVKIDQTNEEYKDDEIVIKGYFSQLKEGTMYTFFGEMDNHPKFGRQYEVLTYQTYIPTDREGLITYLSSDLFYGVGKKTAGRIVDHLGKRAVKKILDDHEVLYEVPHLSKKVADGIVETLQKNQGFENIVVEFTKYNVGLKMCQHLFQKYKHETLTYLMNDPYQFVFDIEGFSFYMADAIAADHDLPSTHPNRMYSACIHVLQESIQEGHVYLPLELCIQETIRLLATSDVTEPTIVEAIQKMNQEKQVIVNEQRVYLPTLYYAEDGFSANVKRILSEKEKKSLDLVQLMKIIGDIEEEETISYSAEQFEAIQKALQEKMMIVTGGPGTGKTTVIKGILNAYARIHEIPYKKEDYEKSSDYPFVLTAPTGRAAQRLSESTGLKAMTIHRLLGWNGEDQFEKDEHEPLNGKYLVIDEFSMVDIWLANRLFKAIPDDMQVLIIGDEDQLPSVGPGQVLSDLLNSESMPAVSLHEVYRQKEGSKIIELAHEIKNDTCGAESLVKSDDFSFISCRNHQVLDVIVKIFKKAKEKDINLKDIQVLAPMYRRNQGIHAINKELQKIVNPYTPQKRETRFQDIVFRVGDKVLQLVNQPEDGISNGDIGEIVALFKPKENKDNVEQLVVAYGEKEVIYERQDYIHMMHAYCISIHKSQGSEFSNVVLPVVSSYRRMLKKNLLYTAVTRGKQSLIICGEKSSFLQGIQTLDHHNRYSSLQEQLLLKMQVDELANAEVKEEDSTEGKEREKTVAKKEEEDSQELSPYDFM